MKRYISLLLTAAMLLSLLIVPASAEETPEMELQVLSFTENLGAIVEGQPLNSAKPEDLLAVKVLFNNKTENTINFGGYAIQIEYDKDLFTPYSYNYEEEGFTSTAGPIIYSKLIQRFANESNAKKEGLCEWTGGIASPLPIDTNKTLVLGYALFKVKADVESTTTEFKFSNNSEKNFIASSKPEQGGVSDVDYVPGVSFDAAASLTINGVAPELDYVEVTDATGNVLAYSKSETEKYTKELRLDAVTLDSNTSHTYFVKAYSKKGTDITDQVQWSISHDPTKTVGAQLDETDKENKIVKVTIPEKGGRPNGVTLSEITAKMPEAETSKTAKILYRRADSIPTSADISLRKGSSASLQVPGTNAADVTAQFDAVVYDQFGEDITRTALESSCYWRVESANAGSTSPKGISIAYNTGLLTVKSDALSTVQNGNTSYTVYIQADQASGGKRVGTYPITVSLSDRVPASIVITGGPEGSTLAVPKTGEQNATYTATVYDQYGDVIANPSTIEWKLRNESTGDTFSQKGVTIDQNGVVTVTKEAAGNDFIASSDPAKPNTLLRPIYIKATCGNVSRVETLILSRETATVTSLALDGDAEIAVPKNDEAEVTRSYLNAYDQYGVEMNSSNLAIEWKKDANVKGVNFVNGGIKVTSAAAENKFTEENGKLQFTFDISASIHGNNPVTKTITLTRQQAEATSFDWDDDGINNRQAVPHRAGEKVPASVKVIVRDQYGQRMTDAEVQPNGALPTGIILENGKLYITKDAVDHFNGVRGDSTKGIRVSLKSGNAQVTVTVHLKLADAQTNPQSAEISGQNKIARPTDDTPNTAEYSIGAIVDQYGLPITFEPEKLEMELTDKNGFAIADSKNVTLSKGENGNWIISVTKDAATQQTYVLMAKYKTGGYDAIQCAPVMEITITDKAVSETPLPVVQGDITYGETVSPSVSNTPAGAGTITYTYVGRDGTTYNSSDAPTNAGKYTVTATCEDANYIYTGSVDFQILPKEIKVDWIELTNDEYTYNGREQTVQYTVKDGDEPLVEGTDYTVEGDKQTNAGVHLLKIIGTGNYISNFTAAAGAPSVTWNIWEATLTVTGADIPAINYDSDFDGALNVNSVTFSGLMNGETLAKGTDYTVAATVGNRNAGTHQVVLTVRLLNGNYKFEQGSGIVIKDNANITVTINKIDHQAEAVSVGCKYGSTVRVPLAEYLPDGWSVRESAISVDSNGNGNVHKSFRLEDTTLVVELNNNEALVGKYVKITLPVASTNYNPFTITVTVTVQNKKTQTVTANDLNVTYGDAGVKLNASALDNAKLTYQVTVGADVVTVDTNGNVTLRKSGTAKIQITAAETEDYGTANTTVTVTVAKRSLTVKADDLTAYVGGQLPALDYTVTGLVSGETLTTVPELELKDVPAGVDPMKTAGTYTIGFKTAPVADKDKYDLTVETGTLTVSSRPNVNPVPAGNSVKLEEAAGGKLTSSVSRATKGTTVTITVKPDAGYQLEELEVLDKNGEALPLKELANGKFSFQMPDSKVTVQASFVQESTYAGYPDVLPQDWFYSSVRYVTERGLMNGTPNGFEPNMDSSRATIWTILARFSGVDTTVVSGEWYAVARQWAMENGVSDGTNPNGVITREQLATMLYRFAKNKGLVQEPVTADLSVFVDAGQISDYALDAMRWAISVGLLNGMDGSRLAPQGSAARAQVAAMLMRFDQLAK